MKHSAKAIVVLGMFDLARLDRAQPVRIHNLTLGLRALAPTTLISGDRGPRRAAILHFLRTGGLRRMRALYVESSTSTATETDLLLIALARAARIPIIIFIPDGYQYFPAIFPRAGFKMALLDAGWRVSNAAYLRLADALVFPSWGLATYFPTSQWVDILPPGGVDGLKASPLAWAPPTVVYVGAATYRYGSDLLLDAMQQVVARHPTARCHFITVDATYLHAHPARQAAWLTVEQRASDQLASVMATATLSVIPLRRNTYNDLAMPVKLFDSMAHGVPLVVTDCPDMAATVQELQAGLVVEENATALAAGIMRLIEDADLARRLGHNGYAAVQTAHAWSHRAEQLLHMFEKLESERGHAHSAYQ